MNVLRPLPDADFDTTEVAVPRRLLTEAGHSVTLATERGGSRLGSQPEAGSSVALSVFDLFSIGIGPSSSHTVGPMRAARMFATSLRDSGSLTATGRVRAELFGSLGATGHGHGSEGAVLLGLEGADPETVDPAAIGPRVERIRADKRLHLLGTHPVAFAEDDLVLHRRKSLDFHPNGMVFTAYDGHGSETLSRTYYSVGGGFVVGHDRPDGEGAHVVPDRTVLPRPFRTGSELLAHAAEKAASMSAVMLENELVWRSAAEVHARLLKLWGVMQESIAAGCGTRGVLPGGLHVRRRAAELFDRMADPSHAADSLAAMDWVSLYAIAVNEQNAAGGRIVTAPTNGAAGVVPAVLEYYQRFVPGADDGGVVRFLLTAGAIGIILKETGSISGAEVGCQGEVGSACAMAAGALAEVMGGSPAQAENAAEIAIEHNLGLTCDPIGGLVQIPCIERNAVGAVKAITAARLALGGDGAHFVSLDKVIKVMRETGRDMSSKYKETSRGGLAVNVVEC